MPADAVTTTAVDAPGFYGKLPARGDFIGRRLGRPLVDAWDSWLQQAILASREALGVRWLEIYLTSPLWRFALGAGSCGPIAAAGVMMPSVDTVGRSYPLMMGREFADRLDPAAFVPAAALWYQALEELALAALGERFDLAQLDRPVPLQLHQPMTMMTPAAPSPPPPGRHLLLDGDSGVAALCRQHGTAAGPLTIWWTTGSPCVAPCLLICPGMPSPSGFAALLDGDFRSRGWLTDAPAPDLPILAPPAPSGVAPWEHDAAPSAPPPAEPPRPEPPARDITASEPAAWDREAEPVVRDVEPRPAPEPETGGELAWDREE